MAAEGLRADIGEAGFFQSDVAGGAAIYDSELRKPDLLDAIVLVKVALQGYRFSAIRESASDTASDSDAIH